MKNSTNFANIDKNRIASKKQQWAVASHFASIHASVPSERYGLTRCFNAILNQHFDSMDAKLTHGDVQEFFEFQNVPSEFLSKLQAKPSEKVKTAKPKAKKASKKPTAKVKPKASDLENRVASIEDALSQILAAVAAK